MPGHTLYVRVVDGLTVDEAEACQGGALKPGYAIRFGGALLRDARTVDAQERSQDAYEARLRDSWRKGLPAARIEVDDAAARARAVERGLSRSQSVYEERVSRAWQSGREP
jgi:hypothetical protein